MMEPGSGRLTTRSVTPETALQLSAVWACVRLLSETIAGLPLYFYEVKAGGKMVKVLEHDLYWLLASKPNRYQTRVEFFETLMFQLALHGNVYSKIDYGTNKKIVSLMPFMTLQVETTLENDGRVTHKYNNNGQVQTFADEEVWHSKLFGNGIVGLSPLNFARNSIGIGISGEDRVNRMANGGFKQSGVFMIDKILGKDQRKQVRENFSELSEGGNDSMMILESGAKWQPTVMNPKDVQLLETRRFQTEEIARFWNVPSVLINDTSSTTVWGSGIEQIISGFYKLGLKPYTKRLEASVSNRLLPVADRRTIVPYFDMDELLRGDEKTRFEGYRTAISSAIKTPNECRAVEGLDPKPGGDELMIQTSIVPMGSQKNGGKNNEPSKKADSKPV